MAFTQIHGLSMVYSHRGPWFFDHSPGQASAPHGAARETLGLRPSPCAAVRRGTWRNGEPEMDDVFIE